MSEAEPSQPEKKAPIGNQAGPHDYPEVRNPPNAWNVPLMEKQERFVMSDAEEVCYSGAFGAGKSRALGVWAVRKALEHPSARVGLFRKTLVSLRSTTMKTLLEPDGDLPPILPPESYVYHKVPGEMEVRVKGGGTIIPGGCDNELAIGSLNLSACGIDEGVELDHKEYVMLSGRCRVTYTMPDGRKNINQIVTATNPGPPSHFLYDIFFKKWKDLPPKKRPKGVELIETNMLENHFLKPEYIQRMLRSTSGPTQRRVVYGEWVAFEGAIYPMFDMQKHQVRLTENFTEFVTGVDVGYGHKTAIRVWGCYGREGQAHCVSSMYASGADTEESMWETIVGTCKEASRFFRPMTFVVDPSAAMVKDALKKAGLHVKELPSRDVLFGIKLVQNALSCEINGIPKMTFEPDLAGTEEYLSYRWKPKAHSTSTTGEFESAAKEGPVKELDDALDADRYAWTFIAAMRKGEMTFLGPADDDDEFTPRSRNRGMPKEATRLEQLINAGLRGEAWN